MFSKVLIANRGEIACRIIRTLQRLGVRSVAVYAESDRYAAHVLEADEAVAIGPAPVAESYLRQQRLISAAHTSGAQAIHPGYGFLSEHAAFAELCAASDLVFIGPTAAQIREFGLKHRAREMAAEAAVPLLPGSGLLRDAAHACLEAQRIGYPVMLKSTAGGGGIGMQLLRSDAAVYQGFDSVERIARKNFSRGGVFLERFIERARHIEVQIFGDGRGQVIALGERDCSVQRRNQKLIEETPAHGLPAGVRSRLVEAAVRLGKSVDYRSAGTVEFVYDTTDGEFYFLEVNTRLQVEHGVTETVTGIDLVEWMLKVGAGEVFDLKAPEPVGAAIEARIYAEDPAHEFRPSTGLLTRARFPDGVRVDTWVKDGTTITPFYDPLLAKVIVHGADRGETLTRLAAALAGTEIAGIETNLDYLRQLVASPAFSTGGTTTRLLESFEYRPQTIDVIRAGTQTTVQDHPGRIGFWDVGVPPSGPMDDLSFRLANRAVGNSPAAAGLEITLTGPVLRFNTQATICLAGATMSAAVDGAEIPFWQPVSIRAGATLTMGSATQSGCRAYLAIAGGLDVPRYMGSRATFTLGKFGGHGGRALASGDVLHCGSDAEAQLAPAPVPFEAVPQLTHEWELGVLYGPHGAPDFFTPDDLDDFFAADWTVHYNSNRTGVRLVGPKPRWARRDGGEAGLHPSNIHDNAYAIGAVDFTGDMPVILGPDGPSLGGFVCPVTLASSELWKLGQLRSDDRVRFKLLTQSRAQASPILAELPASAERPRVIYRRCGDANILVEYGPLVLDLELRLRVHALLSWLTARKLPGIVDLTPGIRSFQVHYDARSLPLDRLLGILVEGEGLVAGIDDLEIPTRIVRLPLSWDDEATRLAIDKYMQSVRADAPWCPSNIEFIRRINGLDSTADVKRIVFDASYLVLGLGDVYLGAPVATPLDPRHRLVTTKYNPARTWTPENAVGIGGAYLCVYGMEGPGGYQFVGRTCQMWNTYEVTREFSERQPWLLRFFDQIRFYPVSGAELLQFRADFQHGLARLDITEDVFKLRDYRRFLSSHSADIEAHKSRQQNAFDAERRRWEASGQIGYHADLPEVEPELAADEVGEACIAVPSPAAGNVWRIEAVSGQRVAAGDTLLVVESMKMELPVAAPVSGTVSEIRCTEGKSVSFAQTLVVLRMDTSRAPATLDPEKFE